MTFIAKLCSCVAVMAGRSCQWLTCESRGPITALYYGTGRQVSGVTHLAVRSQHDRSVSSTTSDRGNRSSSHRIVLSERYRIDRNLVNMAKTFSKDNVAAHNKPDDLWVIVDDDVYDLTSFQVCLVTVVSNLILIITGKSPRRQKDSPTCRRQRCLQAILEVPQRVDPQKVSETAARRITRLETAV